MESTDTTAVLEPEAEAPEAQPDASAASASQPEASDAEISATMNALLRGGLTQAGPSSNPDATDQETDEANAEAGASAPPGDVKPADAKAPGRRSAAARIAELEAENARLTKAYEEANPPPPDASEEARKAAWDEEQEFRRLSVKPWKDTDWTQKEIDFLEEQQNLRKATPKLKQQYDVALEQDLKAQQAQVSAWQQGLRTQMYTDYASAAELHGVDIEALRTAPTFADRDRLIAAAAAAKFEPQIKKLREELSESRREQYGMARTPMNGGRSSAGSTYNENTYMNNLLRGGR